MHKLLKNLPFPLQINKREKIAIWVGAGVVGLFLVLQLIVNPFLDRTLIYSSCHIAIVMTGSV